MLKPTNAVLMEYADLEATVKNATKRMDEIKAACKEIGPFATKDFVVAVTEQSRMSLAGLAEVEKVMDRALLIRHGLLKTTTFQTVKIVKKEAQGVA